MAEFFPSKGLMGMPNLPWAHLNIYLITYTNRWPDKKTISDLTQISIVCDPVGPLNIDNGFKLI